MKTTARVQKGEIIFTSERAKHFFMEKNEGKFINIEPDETVTADMRRYFEGCVVPVVFYTHPRSGWETFRDARETLKLEFLPTRTVKGLGMRKQAIAVPSTTDLTKEQFRKFIDAIHHWLLENGLCAEDDLDSANYVAWRDSAPLAGAIYPPLARLKERYDLAVKQEPPWRK